MSLWARCRAILATWYAAMVAYRAELVLWALAGSFPFIMMGVWMRAGGSGHFEGEPLDFARYFLAVFLARQLTVVWVLWDFEEEVVRGKLAFRLVQPLDPGWHHVAEHVAERGARLPFVVFLLVLFFLLYPEALWVPAAADVLGFLIACAGALALRFLIQYTFGMLAFWTERATSFQRLWFMLYLFGSGMVAPLEVYPELLREVVLWTPFPYLVYLPARLLTGGATGLGQAALVALVWGLSIFALNRLLWRAGLRRFSAMGA